MDEARFDVLTRSWSRTRRGVVGSMVAVASASILGGARSAAAADCRPAGAPCNNAGVCCSQVCSEKLREKKRRKKRRWIGKCGRVVEGEPAA